LVYGLVYKELTNDDLELWTGEAQRYWRSLRTPWSILELDASDYIGVKSAVEAE
jgi:hypothetical protein